MSALDGFLNVYKPLGISSAGVVGRVKRMLPRGTAIGHGGTLDPEAEGVLPLCVGKATRLFDYIVDKQKRYIAEVTLGKVTDTQDAAGTVLEERPVRVGEAEIRAALPQLTGDILQRPPLYSALKRDGKPLYAYARKGQEIAVAPRPVRVDALELLGCTGENRYEIRVDCGKGVYVRTLMHDLGALLGCGGYMSRLARVRAGAFRAEDAIALDALSDVEAHLLPLDFPIGHIPLVRVGEGELRRVQNGNPLYARSLLEAPQAREGIVRVYVGDAFAGMGEFQEDGSVRFRAMLLEKRL